MHKVQSSDRPMYLKTRLFLLPLMAVTFIIYLCTAAYVAYPGESADFYASILFRNQLQEIPQYPLSSLLVVLVRHYFPQNAIVIINSIGALLAATLGFCIARVTSFYMRFCYLDIMNLSFNVSRRVNKENDFLTMITAVCTAITCMFTLPIWTLGGCFHPQTISLIFVLLATSFFLEFRCRIELRQCFEEKLTLRDRLIYISAFILLGFMAFNFLESMVPLIFFAIFAVLPCYRRGKTFSNGFFVVTGVFSVLIGIAGAAFGHVLYREIFFAEPLTNVPEFLMQLVFQQQSSFQNYLFSTTGLGVFYLIAFVAIAVGTFPQAFFNRGYPAVGQALLLILSASVFFHQPAFFWDASVFEGHPLHTYIVILATMMIMMLLASWGKCALDARSHMPPSKAYRVPLLIVTIPAVCITIALLIINFPRVPGNLANTTAEFLNALVEKGMPKQATTWINPSRAWNAFFVNHAQEATRISPVFGQTIPATNLNIGGKSFEARCDQDLVLKVMAKEVSPFATWCYLFRNPETHNALCLSQPKSLPYPQIHLLLPCTFFGSTNPSGIHLELNATQLFDICTEVDIFEQEVMFAKTPIGERVLTTLKQSLAQVLNLAACQIILNNGDQQIASRLTLKAQSYFPENPAYLLNLGYLADSTTPLSAELRHDILTAQEDTRTLMQASDEDLIAFINKNDLLLTPEAFERRLQLIARFSSVEEALAAIHASLPTLKPGEQERRIELLAILGDTETAEAVTRKALEQNPGDTYARNTLLTLICQDPFHPKTSERIALLKTSAESSTDPVLHEINSLDQWAKYKLTGRERARNAFIRTQNPRLAQLYINQLLSENDFDAILTFVNAYTSLQVLLKYPLRLETARLQILKAYSKDNPTQAIRQAHSWLIDDPHQPRIWTWFLTQIATSHDPAYTLKAQVRTCLRNFPCHPTALDLLAAELKEDYPGNPTIENIQYLKAHAYKNDKSQLSN